ncbi:hypothetical protein TNCV_2027261 [Trichonephila clavipes]|nr:hypothetical protein TNCV_2027261 [Trichonephila clavipes]
MRLVERKGTIDFEWRCRVQSKENPHFVCRSVRKAGVKNGRSPQGKLADGTVVEVEAGASFYTDPISDV